MANGVTIDLIVDPKKAILGLGQVESRSSSVANVLGRLGHAAAAGVVALGVASAAAGAAVAALVVSSVKAAAEAQKVNAQTVAVLTSTGGAAGKSAKQLDDMAKSLARISGIDKETVKSSENLLLTFTAIKGLNFDTAQKAVLDLSQAMGKDLQSSTILVGKALNDPIKGLTSLTRVGVRFTAQQREQIANFVKAGDVASAQAVILKELNTEFGGSAAAFGNTFLGSVGRAKTSLQELKEEVGGAFLPVLTAAAGSVAKIFNAVADNPKFKSFLDGLDAKLSAGLKPLTDLIAAAAGSSDPFGTLLNGLEKVSPAFAIIREVFDAIKPELPALQSEFAQLGAVIGAGLAQYGPQLATSLGEVVVAIVPLIPQILTLIPPLLELATTVIPPLIDVLNLLIPPLDFIIQGFAGGLQAVTSFGDVLAGNTSLVDFGNGLRNIAGPFGAFEGFLQDSAKNVTNWAVGVVRTIQGVVSDIAGAFAGAGKWLVDAGKNIIQGLLDGINGAWKFVEKAIRNLFGGVVDLVKSVLGIHSPSTVFADVGVNLVAGLERGLTGPNNLGSIMSDLSSQVRDGFQGSISATARATVATSVAGAGVGGGSVASSSSSRPVVQRVAETINLVLNGRVLATSLREYDRATR